MYTEPVVKLLFSKDICHDNTCTIYLFLSHECYHVPVKLRELNGLLHTFALSGQLKAQNLQLLKAHFVGYSSHKVAQHYPKHEWQKN